MSVAHCHQKITSPEMPVQGHGKVPEAKTIHMLGFGIGNERYGIDLKEAVEVIRDLVIMQSCTSTSMTERFVKCNRRNTIVFNLDQCLTIQGEHPPGGNLPVFSCWKKRSRTPAWEFLYRAYHPLLKMGSPEHVMVGGTRSRRKRRFAGLSGPRFHAGKDVPGTASPSSTSGNW